MKPICIKALVSGKVQGVWYRKSTQRKAKECGVQGWARNLADGRVEVLLCGDATAVQAVADWLWQGPSRARVDGVEIEELAWQPVEGFTTG